MGEFTKTEHLDGKVTLYGGDNRDVLRSLPDNSIDSIVTDPPYALVSIVKWFGKPGSAPAKGNDAYMRASAGFMGRSWDVGEVAFSEVFWAECLRVLKPGGHVVAFSGTRTYHRMAVAIEDAGFEIRDDILEMFTTERPAETFLNSLNDEQRAAFARLLDDTQFTGLLGWAYGSGFPKSNDVAKAIDKSAGFWRGKAGAVKDETVGQVAKGTEYERTDKGEPATNAARQWQGWGTALKPAWEPICLARKPLTGTVAENVLEHGTGAINVDGCRVATAETIVATRNYVPGGLEPGGLNKSDDKTYTVYKQNDAGRWPANIVHDGGDEVTLAFPDDAARFFYTAKADKLDRIGSKHPTVKPVDLMQWLCRLVTPPGGLVLDPFAGSGSTGEAAWREGFRAILIEREEEYQADIAERLRLASAGPMERKARAIKQANNDNLPLFGGAEAGGTR